jgi:hypothetical protein
MRGYSDLLLCSLYASSSQTFFPNEPLS